MYFLIAPKTTLSYHDIYIFFMYVSFCGTPNIFQNLKLQILDYEVLPLTIELQFKKTNQLKKKLLPLNHGLGVYMTNISIKLDTLSFSLFILFKRTKWKQIISPYLLSFHIFIPLVPKSNYLIATMNIKSHFMWNPKVAPPARLITS